jgi:hypothetical protein
MAELEVKVWPNEAFVEGAEFMASLAKSFENAHGLRLKTAFARSLVQLLHPIGKARIRFFLIFPTPFHWLTQPSLHKMT